MVILELELVNEFGPVHVKLGITFEGKFGLKETFTVLAFNPELTHCVVGLIEGCPKGVVVNVFEYS